MSYSVSVPCKYRLNAEQIHCLGHPNLLKSLERLLCLELSFSRRSLTCSRVLTSSCVRLWIIHEVIHNSDMSFNYGRSLFASAIENHVAIVIACAPAMKSILSRGLYPKVKSALDSSKGKFGKLWSSSSASAPPTPSADRFHLTSPHGGSFPKSSKSSAMQSLSPMFSSSGRSVPVTASSQGMRNDSDIKLGFHDTTCEFVPTITTTITAGGAPLRPPSSKNKIYVTREITITEELITPPSTGYYGSDHATSRASSVSAQCSNATAVSSMDVSSASVAVEQEQEQSRTGHHRQRGSKGFRGHEGGRAWKLLQ
jgi:hypothetical protein